MQQLCHDCCQCRCHFLLSAFSVGDAVLALCGLGITERIVVVLAACACSVSTGTDDMHPYLVVQSTPVGSWPLH